jgi:hypothetical protein
MKRIKILLVFSILASFFSLTVVSCSNNDTTVAATTTTTTAKADSSITDTFSLETRTLKKNIAAKSYYYKTLASFEKGITKSDLEELANLVGKKVSLVVLYEANAPWAETFNSGNFEITGDDQMNGLMASYDLQIVQQFSIDASNKGIVMEATTTLENPIEAAREVSMVDHVLMVNIKEVPATIVTADSEK